MAEREGFEPSVPSPARRISSAVHSTTLPPLREIFRREAKRIHRPGSVEGRALANENCFAKPHLSHFSCLRFHRPYIGTMNSISPQGALAARNAPPITHARFSIGDVVQHRLLGFRGVIFDVDPVFANTEEWFAAIPEDMRPDRDQPFYHLLAENGEASYIAYVSQQNLVTDEIREPIDHPAISRLFGDYADGKYSLRAVHRH